MEGDDLVYAGKVGTGFTEQTLALLKRELEPLARDTSPFTGRQPPKGTRFVEPRLVAHVEFREWTESGTHARALLQGPAARHLAAGMRARGRLRSR